MYCRNCGQQIDDLAAVCIHCGVAVGNGKKFCHNCGFEHPEDASFCQNCGVDLRSAAEQRQAAANSGTKSRLVAGILGILLGSLGVHNFYLGYNNRAVVQLLLTIFGCGIGAVVSTVWGLVEGIFYLTGNEKYSTDADGNPLGE